MRVQEKIYNELEIDIDTLIEYFNSLEENETPSISGLINFISNNFYISDFIDEGAIGVDYEGDEIELMEYYNEYLSDND